MIVILFPWRRWVTIYVVTFPGSYPLVFYVHNAINILHGALWITSVLVFFSLFIYDISNLQALFNVKAILADEE